MHDANSSGFNYQNIVDCLDKEPTINQSFGNSCESRDTRNPASINSVCSLATASVDFFIAPHTQIAVIMVAIGLGLVGGKNSFVVNTAR